MFRNPIYFVCMVRGQQKKKKSREGGGREGGRESEREESQPGRGRGAGLSKT